MIGRPAVAAQAAGPAGDGDGHARSSAAKAEANLRKDTLAAEEARAEPADGRPTPIEHAMNGAETQVSEEGTNLLAEAK